MIKREKNIEMEVSYYVMALDDQQLAFSKIQQNMQKQIGVCYPTIRICYQINGINQAGVEIFHQKISFQILGKK